MRCECGRDPKVWATCPKCGRVVTEPGRTPETYNATAITSDANGKAVSWVLVQIDDAGTVTRCNGTWSHLNGTPAYHAVWVESNARTLRIAGSGATTRIVRDNGAAYRGALVGVR